MKNWIRFGLPIIIGLIVWLIPVPTGVAPQAWKLFAIFLATMAGVILKPFPMGVVSILSLTVTVTTGVLTFQDAFSGFSNDVVWLVVFAFFVARGFIATGLGNRMAYKVMSLVGKNSLGLGYGLVATDLLGPHHSQFNSPRRRHCVPHCSSPCRHFYRPLSRSENGRLFSHGHSPRLSDHQRHVFDRDGRQSAHCRIGARTRC